MASLCFSKNKPCVSSRRYALCLASGSGLRGCASAIDPFLHDLMTNRSGWYQYDFPSFSSPPSLCFHVITLPVYTDYHDSDNPDWAG